MAAVPSGLATALHDRYRLDRELGQGGMATVYLAEDLKHHRKVAVKVLRPELAATMGPERFAREIEVAARLQHPHILGLLDSGDADGFFYYVMPYVEGETLRDRLARAGELPVLEAVRLLGEITEALALAHRAGVVHRDIKPENVLLSGRHALVMDFGVAKAVTEASGRQQLTTAGVALGTPAYMAPEQATADPQLDGRVDIYALGVVGYEMLTGHPPFHGLNPQQTLAAHLTQAPAPVGERRPGLSPAVESVIMKCLAKRPADRYQTADELVAVLEPLATPSGGVTPPETQPARGLAVTSHRSRLAALGVLAAAVVAVLLWRPWSSPGAEHRLDPNLVAVLPFRVAGADPSLQYLRQGMVDLLQTKLTGAGGPRAADARSVLAAVRDAGGTEAIDIAEAALPGVARRIGAGRILQGSIVGPADHVVLSAALLEIPGGRTVAQTSVEGPKDSLFPMVDRLTAQLLALGAGASTTQLSALTTTSLDALRLYLDGMSAYRRGAFDQSTALLTRSVQLDSTFALALSALLESNGWIPTTLDFGRVQRLAWRYRDRLNPRDQLVLLAQLGSRYPEETPAQELIADLERGIQTMPESPDAWYRLGDALFHAGALAEIPDWEGRSQRAFEEALRRDSLYGASITHLARLAFISHDTSAQRALTRRLLALDSSSTNAEWIRWDMLCATRDAQGIEARLARRDSAPALFFAGAALFGVLDSVTTTYHDRLLADAWARSNTTSDRIWIAELTFMFALNGGRPAEAQRWVDTLKSLDPGRWAAILARSNLVVGLGAMPNTAALRRIAPRMQELSALGRGDLSAGDRYVALARAGAARDTSGSLTRMAALIEAWTASHRGASNAGPLTEVADSLWRGFAENSDIASILLARMYESQGRVDRARVVLGRRVYALGYPVPDWLADALRLEGRLAAKAGDRAAAIRAYRKYLLLRFDPEPSLLPQRDSVRAELTALGDVEGRR